MIEQINNLVNILSSFLGKPKNDYVDENSTLKFEFNCPKCAEENGYIQDNKYNLSVSLDKGGGLFNCWKCSTHSDEMKGRIKKLFMMYGTEELWQEYKDNMRSLRESELYKLHFGEDSTKLEDEDIKKELDFPYTFKQLDSSSLTTLAFCYLRGRGIDERIIKKYGIGYTVYDKENPTMSYRIVIPSYNSYGELNYWVGRDYTGKSFQRYCNPKLEKKNIIFGENLINWDNDITLCEGAFDAIVVPNSIPLLGKSLEMDYKLYGELHRKANGFINIFLDGDEVGVKAGIKLYKQLNNGRLYGKVRYVSSIEGLDPSEIYSKYGKDGIIHCIRNARKFKPYIF